MTAFNATTTIAGTTNTFTWDDSKEVRPDIYAGGKKVTIEYDDTLQVATGKDSDGTSVFTVSMTMADGDATSLSYVQDSELLGVKSMADGDIILPGGGNQDYRIFQFTKSDTDSTIAVDALVAAHNLIEDTSDEINNIGTGAGAEHTVNTNNFYIGVDSNNMNAGQQLVFDFATVDTYDGITTSANEVASIDIKLFNFGSEKSGDELFIKIYTSTGSEEIRLTQDSDYTSELEYTITHSGGDSIEKVEFLAGNESSFKLGIQGISSIDYHQDFDMQLGYTITDESGDVDNGVAVISLDGNDIVEAKTSDDVILYDSADTAIDGGAGIDTLVFVSGESNIDFTKLDNIEQIDLTQNGAHTLDGLTLDNVLDMTDTNNELTIIGDAGDAVANLDTTGWTAVDSGDTDFSDGKSYNRDSDSASLTLTVDDQIDTSGM